MGNRVSTSRSSPRSRVRIKKVIYSLLRRSDHWRYTKEGGLVRGVVVDVDTVHAAIRHCISNSLPLLLVFHDLAVRPTNIHSVRVPPSRTSDNGTLTIGQSLGGDHTVRTDVPHVP